MKLGIIGSRSFSDYDLLDKAIKEYFCDYDDAFGYDPKFSEYVSGGASGVDKLSKEWVEKYNVKPYNKERRIKITEFLPDYNKYGKGAPLIRNELIIKEATHVLAIWDSVSRGTQNSLSIAKRLKKPTLIIYF